jgi:LacI family transcriptional regulator
VVTVKLKNRTFEKDLTLFLEEHPLLAGIFVTTSKGHKVSQVLHTLERPKIAMVGYDLLEENLNYLNKGTIDFLIHQNPKRQAYLGVVHLVEHFLFNKEIPKLNLLPIDIINSENAKYHNL